MVLWLGFSCLISVMALVFGLILWADISDGSIGDKQARKYARMVLAGVFLSWLWPIALVIFTGWALVKAFRFAFPRESGLE